jgi:hypothetical protein
MRDEGKLETGDSRLEFPVEGHSDLGFLASLNPGFRFMTLLQELHAHPDPERTLTLLQQLSARATRASALFALHEALLFFKAYPRSPAIRAFCEAELSCFHKRIEALDADQREMLAQTGIVGTQIYYSYDHAMAKWLMNRVGAKIEVDWETHGQQDTDPLSDYLPMLTFKAEGDVFDVGEVSTRDFIETARGPSHATSAAWLVDSFDRAFAGPVRDQIYNSMQIPMSMELTADGLSRTLWDDGSPKKLFIWEPDKARGRFDLVTEIRKPMKLGPPMPLARGRELLDLARGALLPRLRELYPATHGNPAEVYDVGMDRGVRMILWFMVPEFRLPLEAGWGLLILKNNVPIGYGAGGMLHDRSEIAINVFDTFRGGEAAWLYAQLARMLNSICHAPWLVTRRYQLGYENDEGLKSGSYWFYDKLGFRSVGPEIRTLADKERALIAKHKGYRSPRRVLKKLSAADAVLSLEGKPAEEYREFPLGPVGLSVTRAIAREFGGDRAELEARILKKVQRQLGLSYQGWSAAEKTAFAQMSLFALLQEDSGIPSSVVELGRLKGSAREADYARSFRKNRRFFEELARLGKIG